jgi:predicted small secreted protein
LFLTGFRTIYIAGDKAPDMQFAQSKTVRLLLFLLILIYLLLSGCNSIESKGVMKDMNTGMVTHWTKANPESVVLMMKGEELGHTDIPLGENFQLIAKNIKGLAS